MTEIKKSPNQSKICNVKLKCSPEDSIEHMLHENV